jgi:hypothetical protein
MECYKILPARPVALNPKRSSGKNICYVTKELMFALSTPWLHIGGIEVELHSFLTTAVVEVIGERHTPAALPPGEIPGIRWIVGWLGPQIQSGHFGEEKILIPLPRFEPQTV